VIVMLLRFTARVFAFLLAVAVVAAPARAADDAAGFITDLGQRTVLVLAAKVPEGERETRFRAIFEEGFDVPADRALRLAIIWRTASEEQRRTFVALFETYVVHAYAVRSTTIAASSSRSPRRAPRATIPPSSRASSRSPAAPRPAHRLARRQDRKRLQDQTMSSSRA